MCKKQIFISYRHDHKTHIDEEVGANYLCARLLYGALIDAGYQVYLDMENRTPGNFNDNLPAYIDQCDCVICVLSPSSVEKMIENTAIEESASSMRDESGRPHKDVCHSELYWALQKKKCIIPCYICDLDASRLKNLPGDIRRIADFEHFDFDVHGVEFQKGTASEKIAPLKGMLDKYRIHPLNAISRTDYDRTMEYYYAWSEPIFLHKDDPHEDYLAAPTNGYFYVPSRYRIQEIKTTDRGSSFYLQEGDEDKYLTSPDSISELLGDRSRLLLILGAPGIGKSTVIRHYLQNGENLSHTVVYRLQDYIFSRTEGLEWNRQNQLYDSLIEKTELKNIENKKNLTLILDGFDEISLNTDRENILQSLIYSWHRSVSNQKFKNIIITCRSSYIVKNTLAEKLVSHQNYFTCIELHSFDKKGIEQFCEKFTEKYSCTISPNNRGILIKDADKTGSTSSAVKSENPYGIPLILLLVLDFVRKSGGELSPASSLVDAYRGIFDTSSGIVARMVKGKEYNRSLDLSDEEKKLVHVIQNITEDVALRMFERYPERAEIPLREYQQFLEQRASRSLQDDSADRRVSLEYYLIYCEKPPTKNRSAEKTGRGTPQSGNGQIAVDDQTTIAFVHRTMYEYLFVKQLCRAIRQAGDMETADKETFLAAEFGGLLKLGNLSNEKTIRDYIVLEFSALCKENENFAEYALDLYDLCESTLGRMLKKGMLYDFDQRLKMTNAHEKDSGADCVRQSTAIKEWHPQTAELRCFSNMIILLRQLKKGTVELWEESDKTKAEELHNRPIGQDCGLNYYIGFFLNMAENHNRQVISSVMDEMDGGRDVANEKASVFHIFLRDIFLQEADLSGLDFWDKEVSGADLASGDNPWHTSGLDLSELNLREVKMKRTNLRDADLSGADLRGADLQGTDLCGAFLENADLRGTKLTEANLRGACLRNARFKTISFDFDSLNKDAILIRADLQYMDLTSIDLSGRQKKDMNSCGQLMPYGEVSFPSVANDVLIANKHNIFRLYLNKARTSITLQCGSCCIFGRYPQSRESTEPEPIVWIILAIDGDRALLLSEKILDNPPYHKHLEEITWADSSVRAWLNSIFLLTAFRPDEQRLIQLANVSNDNNEKHKTPGGINTVDRIFLPSLKEARAVYHFWPDHIVAKGSSYIRNVPTENGTTWWRLRSSGQYSTNSATVYGSLIDEQGVEVNLPLVAIRPALWVNLKDGIAQSLIYPSVNGKM